MVEPQILSKVENKPPTKTDPELAKKEMELKFLASFMGSPDQKTQKTPSERILLSTLQMIARDPFPSARKASKNKDGSPLADDAFKVDFLLKWIEDYLKFGIPMNRQGRKEEVDVLSAYFSRDQSGQSNNDTTSKLLK